MGSRLSIKRSPSIDPVAPPIAGAAPSSSSRSTIPPTSVVQRKGRAALEGIVLSAPPQGYWIVGALIGFVAVLVIYVEIRLKSTVGVVAGTTELWTILLSMVTRQPRASTPRCTPCCWSGTRRVRGERKTCSRRWAGCCSSRTSLEHAPGIGCVRMDGATRVTLSGAQTLGARRQNLNANASTQTRRCKLVLAQLMLVCARMPSTTTRPPQGVTVTPSRPSWAWVAVHG